MASTPTKRKRRQHGPLPLMGPTEAAQCLGVQISNLQPKNPETKKGIEGLPEPVAVLQGRRIWWGPDIEAFAKEYAERKRNATR